MKTLLLLLLLFSTTVFANIGKITALKGDVTLERESATLAAQIGDILEAKDKIITGDGSKVLLMFEDKTVITVGKNSEFEVESYLFDKVNPPKNEAKFKFAKGIFRTITGGIGKLNKEKFVIKTKSASIGIRGTIFLVEVQPEQNLLNIGVEDGEVFMSPLDQGINPQDIAKGQALTYNDETKQFKVIPLAEAEGLKTMQAESKELEDEAVASGQMEKEDTQSTEEDKEEKPKEDKKEAASEEKQDATTEKKPKEETPVEEQKNGTPKEELKDNNTEAQPQSDNTPPPANNDTPPVNNNIPQGDGFSSNLGENDIAALQQDLSIPQEQTNQIRNTVSNIAQKNTNDAIQNVKENTQKALDDAIENQNSNPQLSLSNQKINENSYLYLTIDASDPDNDSLTYEITTSPTNGFAEIFHDNEIYYTPNSDFYGTDTLTITVEDGKGGSVSQNITFTVNDIPEVQVSDTQLDEDTSTTISFIASDNDNDADSLSYTLSNPSNGTATLSGNDISYTPNANFAGTDTITLSVDDGNGGLITKTITFTVNNVPEDVTGSLEEIQQEIQQITGVVLPQDNLANLDYGFIVPSGETNTLNAYDTYISGELTPDAVIEAYITHSMTGSYNGGISALVNGTASDGTIDLTIQFGEQNPISGSLNITESNWQGSISNGNVTPYGFNASSITGSSDFGSITNGSLTGKFYGTAGDTIGGKLNLKAGSATATGVYGASGSISP